MKKVSVIVPVYNAAEFLAETLDTILNQTLEDIEVIAVNDGSADNSWEILEDYAARDTRMHIIDQKNGGPSAARNNGLNYAEGEYVFFFDSDDLLVEDALEIMYEKAKRMDADLVIGKYDIFNGVSLTSVKNLDELVSQDVIDKYDKGILWTFSLSNKLFRRAIIESNHFRFEPISYSEDGVFTMNFVHHAKMITGSDNIVFHYRRMPFAIQSSITSTVNASKIKDYLTAHKLIYLHLKQSIREEFSQYADFGELLHHEDEMNQYMNEFLKKEINVLLNQFYKKFWQIEENTLNLLAKTIYGLLQKVNLDVYYQLAGHHAELDFDHLYGSYDEARKDCRVAAVLYGHPERKEEFYRCLKSLFVQTLIPVLIYVPLGMKTMMDTDEVWQENIIFIDCEEETEFYQKALGAASSEYIVFAEDRFSYEIGAFYRLYHNIRKMNLDVFDSVVNINIGDKAVMCSWHNRAMNSMKNFRIFGDYSKRDAFLPNKMIRVDFLRNLKPDFAKSKAVLTEEIMQKAYFAVSQKVNIVFEEGIDDESFIRYLKASDAAYFNEIEMPSSARSLHDKQIQNDLVEIYKKLMPSKLKKKENRKKRRLINWISKLPVQNKVLFYSIRKENELEGNLKAIYDSIEGNKIVCAHMLPHDSLWKLKMYYEFATSKVIIVDDYARYLRLFPMKPEQRVIQLWHACGAFKKFGIHGTNLSMREEKATHMQYNLVCVSAENIRQIYASAFDIDVAKVSALGVPRTDMYFDQMVIKHKQAEILEKYPEWRGKRIILYAPTFRDKNAKRSEFKPDIDFDDLSRRLGDNTVFIIAPHPVMTEKILSKTYPNIQEIRDISTGDLMFVSDLMVTDYSSVIFEYALLNKPIVFYCYDKAIYNRGFYLDYDHDLPGEIFEDYESFAGYLEHPEKQIVTEKHQKFIEKYMSACDGHSTERIAGIINRYIGGQRNE